MFEDMKLTAVGSYSTWNFLERIRKRVESAMVVNKNAT